MRLYFLFAVFILHQFTYSQTSDQIKLYDQERYKAIQLKDRNLFAEAISAFMTVRTLPGKKVDDDLDSLIQETLETWVNTLKRSIEAESRAREEVSAALELAESRRKDLEQSQLETILNSKLMAANRLALLANKFLEEGKNVESLYLAYRSTQMRSDLSLPQISLSFGNAVYKHLKEEINLPSTWDNFVFCTDDLIFIALDDYSIYQCKLDGLVPRPLGKHTGLIKRIEYNQQSESFLACSYDQTVSIRFLKSPERDTIVRHQEGITNIVLHPNGSMFITTSRDNLAKLWDTRGNLIQTLIGHTASIYGAEFSEDHVLTRDCMAKVILWDLDGNPLHEFSAPPYIYSARFSQDGQRIALASADQNIYIYNLEGSILYTLKGHKAAVKEVMFVGDTYDVISRSLDMSLKYWDSNGQDIGTMKSHTGIINSMQMAPSSKYVVSASSDGKAIIWNLEKDSIIELIDHTHGVIDATFSKDNRILTTSLDGTSKLWDLSGNLLMSLTQDLKDKVAVPSQFSPDGQFILSVYGDSQLVRTPIPSYAMHRMNTDLSMFFTSSLIKELDKEYQIRYFLSLGHDQSW